MTMMFKQVMRQSFAYKLGYAAGVEDASEFFPKQKNPYISTREFRSWLAWEEGWLAGVRS